MSDKQDTASVLDEISRSTSAAKPRRSRRIGAWSVVLLLLLLIPSVAALGWLALQQQDLTDTVTTLQQEQRQLATGLSGSLQQLEEFQQTTAEQLSEWQDNSLAVQSLTDQSSIERLRSQFTRDIERLNSEIVSLQRQLAAVQNRDVHLRYTEVDYLLRLAHRKLTLETDTGSALVLINDADAILAQVDSTMGNTLRDRIADDVRALRAVSLPDPGDTHQRLGNLINSVQSLSIIDTFYQARHETRQEARQSRVSESGEQDTWMATALEVMQNIFVVRQWQEPAAERLSPQRELLAKNTLRLQLEQAQLALLLRDDGLFRASLQSSREQLDQHFAEEASAVQEIQRELDALLQIRLRPELPDMTPTLTIARQLSGAPDN